MVKVFINTDTVMVAFKAQSFIITSKMKQKGK